MKISKNAEFMTQEPLTRRSLQTAQEVLFSSGIPTEALLEVITFQNDQGFKVKAQWAAEWEEKK